MKKKQWFGVSVLVVALAGSVFADDAEDVTSVDDGVHGLYVRLGAGLSMPRDARYSIVGMDADVEFKNGFIADIAIGKEFNDVFRGEVALMWSKNSVDNIEGMNVGIDQSVRGVMLNGYAQHQTDLGLAPYLMAGLGYVNVSIDVDESLGGRGSNIEFSLSDQVFALQLGAGVEYAITDKVMLDLGYRYFMTEDIEPVKAMGMTLSGEVAIHQVMAGIRYKF